MSDVLHVCTNALPTYTKPEVKKDDGSHLIGGLHAKLYDSRMRNLYTIDALYTNVLTRMAPFEGGGVLDVGCGTGALLFSLRNRFPNASALVGLDASGDMLAEAQKDPRSSELTLRQASAASLPFPDSSFSRVVSVLAFHRMPVSIKRKAISEVVRVLKPGGRFILADLGETQNFFWGPLGWLLNLHSFTKENMEICEEAMKKCGLPFTEVAWHRGIIKLVQATKPC